MTETIRSRTRIRAEVGNLERLLTAPALARPENGSWQRIARAACEALDRVAASADKEIQTALSCSDAEAMRMVHEWLIGRRRESPASAIAVAVGLERSAEAGAEPPLAL